MYINIDLKIGVTCDCIKCKEKYNYLENAIIFQ